MEPIEKNLTREEAKTEASPEKQESIGTAVSLLQELPRNISTTCSEICNAVVNSEAYKSTLPVQEKIQEKGNEVFDFYYGSAKPYFEETYKNLLGYGTASKLSDEELDKKIAELSPEEKDLFDSVMNHPNVAALVQLAGKNN